MNVCNINVIWIYYIGHVVIVMWPTSISYGTHNAFPVASWDSEGCTLWNHLDMYCILLCTVNLEPLLFSHTVFIYVIVGKYAIWMQPFFRRNRWMKEWLSQSFWDFISLLGGCTDCQFLPWGGDLHHLMDLANMFWKWPISIIGKMLNIGADNRPGR